MDICNVDEAKFASRELVVARRAFDIYEAYEGNIPEQGVLFPEIFQ